MAKSPVDLEMARAKAIADAKRLMRTARTAALATIDPASGAPLTTLVGVASDFDGAPLFLMSTLARHTQHLAADPRASVLLTEEAERGDPLNHPRLTLNGSIHRAELLNARTRYLQRNPKAKLYVDFADFGFFRLAIAHVHFNGGFGRADALAPSDILTAREAEAALAEAEARLLGWVNGLGDAVVARLAGGPPTAVKCGARSASTPKASTSQPAGRRPGSSFPLLRQTRRTGGRRWPFFFDDARSAATGLLSRAGRARRFWRIALRRTLRIFSSSSCFISISRRERRRSPGNAVRPPGPWASHGRAGIPDRAGWGTRG